MSENGESHLATMAVPRELQHRAIGRHLVCAVRFVPQRHNGGVFWNLAERPCHVRCGKNGVVNAGNPQPGSGKNPGFIAKHVNALSGEQPLHARCIVGIVMIAKDRQRAKWEVMGVGADDACRLGEIPR